MFFRLVRYLHPTDKELRQLSGIKKKDSKPSKRTIHTQNDNIDVFQIPKNLDIEVSNYILNNMYKIIYLIYKKSLFLFKHYHIF